MWGHLRGDTVLQTYFIIYCHSGSHSYSGGVPVGHYSFPLLSPSVYVLICTNLTTILLRWLNCISETIKVTYRLKYFLQGPQVGQLCSRVVV